MHIGKLETGVKNVWLGNYMRGVSQPLVVVVVRVVKSVRSKRLLIIQVVRNVCLP